VTKELRPLIIGIGGTVLPISSTQRALEAALAEAGQLGARTCLFGCSELVALEHYSPGRLSAVAVQLIDAVRGADGVIIASPGYHGSVSGLLKNAVDYLEETARDARPYLTGLPVGLIATAYGWQAAVNTLAGLRSIVHALRGWPTPMGVAIDSTSCRIDDGGVKDSAAAQQISILAAQVYDFASNQMVRAASVSPASPRPITGSTAEAAI
jgi:FMN reductase